MVGPLRKSVGFTGQPLNSGRALGPNIGLVLSNIWLFVNLVDTFAAAWRSLKTKGIKPSMYYVEFFDESTHWKFWGVTVSPRAVKL